MHGVPTVYFVNDKYHVKKKKKKEAKKYEPKRGRKESEKERKKNTTFASKTMEHDSIGSKLLSQINLLKSYLYINRNIHLNSIDSANFQHVLS